jgi:hypothetical protein
MGLYRTGKGGGGVCKPVWQHWWLGSLWENENSFCSFFLNHILLFEFFWQSGGPVLLGHRYAYA